MQTQESLTGARKAAVLALLLGEDNSSAIFKFLHEDEIEQIAKEVAAVRRVTPEAGERVLEEFHQMSLAASYVTRGGTDYAEKVLTKAVGPDGARRILDKVTRSAPVATGFASLARANPQQLSQFILGEQPQTVALILANLDASYAAQLLSLLPDDLRVEVLSRMASLDEIVPEVAARVSTVIDQRLKALGATGHKSSGGVRAVAELLNRLDRTVSQAALEAIDAQSPDLATSIRNRMFVFDDLMRVEDSALREIVQRADRKVLPLALKGAAEPLRERFFANMSKRAADMLREEMELVGHVRVRDVEKAHLEIVSVARALEEEGLLVLGGDSGEAYVQ
jgi:flagellar motor switch protein FliG